VKNLDNLAKKFKTDKSSIKEERHNIPGYTGHDYCRIYELVTSHIRSEVQSVLELGVFKGSSLRMWAEWFPKANIHGFDIKPELKFDNDRIKAYKVDATSDLAVKICKKISPDIIIDDAAHTMNSHFKSFNNLWPQLSKGGLYIIEDMLTCYIKPKRYGGSPTHNSEKERSIEWIAELSKALNYEYYSKQEQDHILKQYPYLKDIDYILSYKSLVVIKKK
jgi:hypothetical protein